LKLIENVSKEVSVIDLKADMTIIQAIRRLIDSDCYRARVVADDGECLREISVTELREAVSIGYSSRMRLDQLIFSELIQNLFFIK
jgi:hypothetical protein